MSLLLLLLACGPSVAPDPPEAHRCDAPKARKDCFVAVPGGTFLAGAQAADPAAPGYDPLASPNEGPPHEVTVGPFWLQKSEATVGSFRACVRDGACSEDDVLRGEGFATSYPASAPDDRVRDELPVNGLSHPGARKLCRWLGGRLPHEAEWELAARGTDGRRWPWGDQARCPTMTQGDAFSYLSGPTGAQDCRLKGPARIADTMTTTSPYGLLAMSGNLWEWTADPYEGGTYVQRGGSWLSASPAEVRAAVRGGVAPDVRLPDVGVRCAAGGVP